MADKSQEKAEKPVIVAKNAAELQKIRLEKLMNNPSKPVHIPEKSKDYKPRDPLEFIRNIWGSSAGAGSGDFHVYRGVRRREYARQKFRKEKEEKEDADDAYREKVENNQKAAEERTAKKRAKRLKKKQKQKNKKPKKEEKEPSDDDDEDEDSDNDNSERGDNPAGDNNRSESRDIETEIKIEMTEESVGNTSGNIGSEIKTEAMEEGVENTSGNKKNEKKTEVKNDDSSSSENERKSDTEKGGSEQSDSSQDR